MVLVELPVSVPIQSFSNNQRLAPSRHAHLQPIDQNPAAVGQPTANFTVLRFGSQPLVDGPPPSPLLLLMLRSELLPQFDGTAMQSVWFELHQT